MRIPLLLSNKYVYWNSFCQFISVFLRLRCQSWEIKERNWEIRRCIFVCVLRWLSSFISFILILFIIIFFSIFIILTTMIVSKSYKPVLIYECNAFWHRPLIEAESITLKKYLLICLFRKFSHAHGKIQGKKTIKKNNFLSSLRAFL